MVDLAKRCFLLLLAVLSCRVLAQPEPLLVTYIEKPPYYYTDKRGQPAGFLLEQTRAALAGINFVLQSRSPSWALEEIRRNARPVCSVGWFSDEYRRSFTQFSLPIYQDGAPVLVFRADSERRFSQEKSVAKLLARDISVGVVGGFSYGDRLNPLLARLGSRKKIAASEEENLAQLLRHEVDAALFNPETLTYFRVKAKVRAEDVRIHRYPDIPAGQTRHLMCSRKTPREVIERFNSRLKR